MEKYREGYYWVMYKGDIGPYIVEIRFESWDLTRDGDRWALWDGDTEIPENEWFKYHFISYIPEPEYPYGETSIKI